MSSTRQVSSEAFSLVMESNRTLTFRFDCAGIIKTASYLDFTQYEQWVHIAITRDANQVTTIYVNGVAGSVTATDSGSWALAGVQTFWGGGYRASNYYYAMRGYIASIRCTINTDGVPNYTGNFTPIQADFETPPQDTFDFLNTDNFRWSYIYDIIGRLEFTGESGRRGDPCPP